MKQEDKELLLIDLCARWPYNNLIVRVTDINDPSYDEEGKLLDIRYMDIDCNGIPFLFNVENVSVLCDITEIKPYLRPMSSMSEEEEREYNGLLKPLGDFMFEQEEEFKPIQLYKSIPFELYDFFNSHHLDFRGLIPMGIALPALENMYK